MVYTAFPLVVAVAAAACVNAIPPKHAGTVGGEILRGSSPPLPPLPPHTPEAEPYSPPPRPSPPYGRPQRNERAGKVECGDHARSAAELFQQMQTATCSSVEYSGAPLEPGDIAKLAAMLDSIVRDGDPLHEIELSKTNLPEDAIATLAPAIAEAVARGCQKVELSGVGMNDNGASALTMALQNMLQDPSRSGELHPAFMKLAPDSDSYLLLLG